MMVLTRSLVVATHLLLLSLLQDGVTSFSLCNNPSTTTTTTTTSCPSLQQSSFVASLSSSSRRPQQQQQHRRQKTRGSGLSMVFERMSEDCIGAIVTSQKQSSKLGLKEVTNEAMMIGIVDRPELSRRTLKKYGITYRRVQKALQEMFESTNTDDNNINKPANSLQALFNKNTNDEATDLPFSSDLKRTLANAGKLADKMGSKQVQSHHVLLSLLEYDGEKAAEVNADTQTIKCGGYAVLMYIDGIDDFEAIDLCNSLIDDLMDETNKDIGGKNELVASGSKSSGSNKTPTLEECGVDLTQAAKDGLLDVVYGRDNEIQMSLRTLVRRRKNNPCLIGEPGVGKTAIVEGIAQILINNKQSPKRLRGYRIISLEMASLVAGTKYRGEFEERLQSIINEVTDEKAPPTILFIDEIHNLVGAGSAEGGMDAANMLKPALARGNLQVIGATTISEYRKYIEKDPALERRLQPLMVKEPSVPDTYDILKAIASKYERHHGVKYSEEALKAAAKLSERYINDRFLPDKAIDLLDEAGAIVQMESCNANMNNYNHISSSMTTSQDDDDDIEDDYDEGDDDDDEYVLSDKEKPIVSEHTVAEVISQWASIPIGKLETDEMDKLQILEDELTTKVKGQYRAVHAVSRAVRRARSGLRDQRRPVASFMFCGPTGVGKTELCKALAETYFGDVKDMIRIDMSEYMEKHSVARLTGPPPGYIGFEDGGQLTEAVRRSPHSVVLLDELEKAHPDVLNILLQIMEDGVLTDGKGRTVNFKNTIIVMTSNVGSKRILEVSRAASQFSSNDSSSRKKKKKIRNDDDMMVTPKEEQTDHEVNDASSAPYYSNLSDVVKEELESAMKPEFLNRIDEIVVFSPLSTPDLRSIAGLLLDDTVRRANAERSMNLAVTQALVDKVMEEGSANAEQFGARPMRRAAQRFFEDTVSDAIIKGFLKEGDAATVDLVSRHSVQDQYSVQITRDSDGMAVTVIVEDSNGGIGSVKKSTTVVNGASVPPLETEAVQL